MTQSTPPLRSSEAECRSVSAEVRAPARTASERAEGVLRPVRDAVGQSALAAWALVVVVLLGAMLRFTGVDWDEGQHLHPDERFLTMVTSSLAWPDSAGQYLDTSANPLNPYNHDYGSYVYGLSPVAVAKALGELSGYDGYGGVYLAGRVMSGAMDLLSLVLVFLIGRRLYGGRAGLLGAFLYAFTVLSIQHSHFFTVDMTMTFYVTLALYLAVRVAQGGGWGSMLGLGLAFGLAVSAKISVLTFLLIIALAFVLRIAASWRSESPNLGGLLGQWTARLGRFDLRLRLSADRRCGPLCATDRLLLRAFPAALAIGGILVASFLAFRIAQPQAFSGPGLLDVSLNPRWREDMIAIQKLVSGETDYPPSHQWAAREPVWYALKNMVLWGLGLPLGIAVWASWALMAYEMYKGRWQHLLPWIWMTLTFFYQSVQFVKTVRYMLPIYPTMALMAGYGLVRLWEWAGRVSAGRRWPRVLAGGAVGAVLLGTVAWALAFSSIYTRPVTRVEASRWIYEHIPPGSAISNEVWDDPLPLNLDGHIAGHEYDQVAMELYWEDVPEKREALYGWLERLDYIVLSSNRLYGSIPRLPTRYPMTTRYYEALFSGELGFEHLVTVASRPRLLGSEIVDDDADETFTVYDHPKVIIFKKRADFDLAQVRELFGRYDLERIVRLRPKQVTAAPNNLMLTADDWEAQRAGGTWSDIFDRAGLANRVPTVTWLVTITVIGLVGFPIGFAVLGRLRDRGHLLSKTLGILLLAYPVWLLASLGVAPYVRATILGVLGALAVGSGLLAWRQRREMARFFRTRWRVVVTNEALFLLCFLAFWLIRRANPDLWHPVTGGEKPMDLAYLNAIIKSTTFPPYDPWFAGGYLNYYYMGHVLVATLIKLTGIVPTVAYNLAIPTLFALTATGAATVVYNLMPVRDDEDGWLPRAQRYGLLGAFLVAVAGNLGEVKLLLEGLHGLGGGIGFRSTIPGVEPLVQVGEGLLRVLRDGQPLPFRPEWWYWNASRVMSHGEINEFPFFTFLYADLHAHLIALPLTLLALGLAVGLLPNREEGRRAARAETGGFWPERRDLRALVRPLRELGWRRLGHLALLALATGVLWAANTWDYPTYLGVALLAVAIAVYHERRRLDLNALLHLCWRAGIVVLLGILLFLPYHRHYGAAYSSVEAWVGEQTFLGAYLLIYALPLLLLASYLGTRVMARKTRNSLARTVRLLLAPRGAERARWWYDRLVRCSSMLYDLSWYGLALLGAVLLWALLSGAWAALFGLPLLATAAVLGLDRGSTARERLVAALIAVGTALTVAVEYIVLKGDIGRMNTVFKFYLQVWVLWGVAGALGLAYLWPRVAGWRPQVRKAWPVVLAGLLVGVSLYPIYATVGKVRDRWDPSLPPGLDGSAYVRTAEYVENGRVLQLRSDLDAIRWLQDNVQGSPVVAEANGPLYHWSSRISTYTGLPTIVGWDWHQRQQRAALSGIVVDWRLQDVRDLYNSEDLALKRDILQRYEVAYVVVGELEAALYAPQGLAAFERLVGDGLQVAYREGPVTIYRVADGATGAAASAEARRPAWFEAAADWVSRHAFWGPVRADGPAPADSPMPATLERPVDELPVVDNRGWNPAVRSTAGQVIVWWLVVQVVGLAAWPLVARAAGPLADGGYGLSKALGLLIVGYLVWVGASLRLVANRPATAWAALALVGAASLLVARRGRLGEVWRRTRRVILVEEALFTAGFLAFVGIRLANPDLWQPWFGGEKRMEIAFLNAITKSAHLPPYDPYYAGGTINYYYYGQYLMAVLIEMVGVAPEIGFNLAVPTLFGLTTSHSFLLGHHLGADLGAPRGSPGRTRLAAGLGAALLVAAMANLNTPVQLAEGLARLGGAALPQGADSAGVFALAGAVPRGLLRLLRGEGGLPSPEYWYQGTRIIPYTINEFPFFSYLFADLHPHMIAVPFGLAVLTLLWVWLAEREGGGWRRAGLAALLALALGALGPMNTWDLPAYVALWVGVAVYGGWRVGCRRGLLRGTALCVGVVAAAALLYAPFYRHYRVAGLGAEWVPAEIRSPLSDFLTVWGTHLLLSFTVLFVAAGVGRSCRRVLALLRRCGVRRATSSLRALYGPAGLLPVVGVGLCVLGALAGLALLAQGEALLGLLTLLVGAGCGALTWATGGTAFLRSLLLTGGLAILLGVELVYVRDFLDGGEWRRMNTVFKLHLQAWVLLSVALGSALPAIWGWIARRRSAGRVAWGAALGALLIGGLAYPFWAVPQRVAQRFPRVGAPAGTLDGTAYMQEGVYHWRDPSQVIELRYDREALNWLWEHVRGTPVLVEAGLGYYREGGLRIVSYTGLPTIVGMHANEQRPWDDVPRRQQDVDALYTTADTRALVTLLARYRVRYVYVGQLERIAYGEETLHRFERFADDGLLRLAYANERVSIYEVQGTAG